MQTAAIGNILGAAGGIGIAQQVYRSLIMKQAQLVSQNQGKQA